MLLPPPKGNARAMGDALHEEEQEAWHMAYVICGGHLHICTCVPSRAATHSWVHVISTLAAAHNVAMHVCLCPSPPPCHTQEYVVHVGSAIWDAA